MSQVYKSALECVACQFILIRAVSFQPCQQHLCQAMLLCSPRISIRKKSIRNLSDKVFFGYSIL